MKYIAGYVIVEQVFFSICRDDFGLVCKHIDDGTDKIWNALNICMNFVVVNLQRFVSQSELKQF